MAPPSVTEEAGCEAGVGGSSGSGLACSVLTLSRPEVPWVSAVCCLSTTEIVSRLSVLLVLLGARTEFLEDVRLAEAAEALRLLF